MRGLKVRAVSADHACMRTFGYIVVGYFLLSFMATGLVFGRQDPAGLLVLGGAAGAFVWLVRSYRGGKGVETIQRGDAARVETTERRLGARAAALVQRLPADPLELPWMVDLEYAYRDDPSQRERLESPYVETRSAAFAARDELERVTRDRRAVPTDAAILLADLDRIASTLGELEATAAGFENRAAESRILADAAPETLSRAEAALERARKGRAGATQASAEGGGDALVDAAAAIDAARTLLPDNPLRAAELAHAADRAAAAVARRTTEVAERPARLRALETDLAESAPRLKCDLAALAAALADARKRYGEPVVAEIDAALAAATAAQRDGEALLASARARTAPADCALADEDDLEGAGDRLGRSTDLLRRGHEQLGALATAALSARGEIERAEAEVDLAWAELETAASRDPGRTAVVARARELTAEARGALAVEHPDWRRAASLAARARELLAGAEPSASTAVAATNPAAAAERAKDARDEAWAWVLAAANDDPAARALVEDAESAYQDAVQASAADGGEANAATVAAFTHAEKLAELALARASERRSALVPPAAPDGADPVGVLGRTRGR